MHFLEEIDEIIENSRETFIELSDQIWDFAETRFEEYQSATLLCHALSKLGFEVETNVGGIETAFVGTAGSGGPIIAILGEFDALANLSQMAGTSKQQPISEGGNGHGCGHNMFGSGSLAAAYAVKQYLEKHQLEGTIRYYGCPGEEGGSGKTFMTREGLFDDVDIAIAWHPAIINSVNTQSSLANYQIFFKFSGKAAHAAAIPHLGRSALDAVELMNVGVNYLREHVIPEARMHYAITNAGGISPNVVQHEAEVLYLIRAPKISQVKDLYNRVCNVAKGAALMTGTEVEIVFDKACSNYNGNTVLEEIMQQQFDQLGPVPIDATDKHFAKAIFNTLSTEEQQIVHKLYPGLPQSVEKYVCEEVFPLQKDAKAMAGSTDVGDVSWVVPTVQCGTACVTLGTPFHTWQMVTQGKSPMAHKGMLHAGKLMAATAIQSILDPRIITEAKKELSAVLEKEPYECPIPAGVQPSPLNKKTKDVVTV